MLHEEFTACPALLRGFQTVSITMHTDIVWGRCVFRDGVCCPEGVRGSKPQGWPKGHPGSDFKRTGQFWSLDGDEAFLALATLHRNGRRHRLFPHDQQKE
jgi:hypothetical protein